MTEPSTGAGGTAVGITAVEVEAMEAGIIALEKANKHAQRGARSTVDNWWKAYYQQRSVALDVHIAALRGVVDRASGGGAGSE